MKFVLFLIFNALCCFWSKAQIPPIPLHRNTDKVSILDSGFVKVLYALNPLKISDARTYDDLQRLEIGSHYSKYYSDWVYRSDSLVTLWLKKNRHAHSVPGWLGEHGKKGIWSEWIYSEVIKNFNSDSLTEYIRMPMYLYQENSVYSEAIPVQDWKIEKDTSMVLGYCCQKATCSFRGRQYEAWFAMDIPISNGPWKLGGLPGLILKAYDQDHLFVYECISIAYYRNKFPITLYNDYNRYVKRKRKSLLVLLQKVNEDFMKVAGIRLVRGKLPEMEIHHYLELE